MKEREKDRQIKEKERKKQTNRSYLKCKTS